MACRRRGLTICAYMSVRSGTFLGMPRQSISSFHLHNPQILRGHGEMDNDGVSQPRKPTSDDRIAFLQGLFFSDLDESVHFPSRESFHYAGDVVAMPS